MLLGDMAHENGFHIETYTTAVNHTEPEPGTDPELEPDPDENDKVEPECIIKEEPIDTEEDDHDQFTALNGDQTQEEMVKEEPEDFLEQSLVEEIEALCLDARIEPGQEPTGPAIEAALDIADVTFAPVFDGDSYIQFDDRAVRDSFLRFFCFTPFH